MFCSTIIPTIGRQSLTRAVQSVLDQAFVDGDFEIIVVNDAGQPLPESDWQHLEQVQVINTQRRERSVARNTGAAVARGRYLHFLDDDDWLAPGALQSLWALAQQAGHAVWLYGSSQLVNRSGNPLIQLHHEFNGNCFIQVLAGEWIPLQASLINAESFFAVGGFNPLLSGPEDIDLLRRVALRGSISGTKRITAYISRGEEESTTNYKRHAYHSRWAREGILNEPGVFARMRASATSAYWHGRIVRVYFTSLVWNLWHRRPALAASRATFGSAGLVLAGPRLVSGDFWRAVTKPYASETFARGLQDLHV